MANKQMKRELWKMSSPEERGELMLLELDNLSSTLSSALVGNAKTEDINKITKEIGATIQKLKSDYSRQSTASVEALKEMQDAFLKGLKELKGTLESGYKASDINKNAGPLYKTMINHLAGMETAFKQWKYPQYSSVSVRNKSFENINPAINIIATSIADGTKTVTTAGTRVQITATSTPCTRVVIQAHESNTGTIVVGSSTVVAALVGRRGWAMYPTNSQEFWVSDLSYLYIDSTVSGDKVNYYYEINT